jgi:hypothetical protein
MSILPMFPSRGTNGHLWTKRDERNGKLWTTDESKIINRPNLPPFGRNKYQSNGSRVGCKWADMINGCSSMVVVPSDLIALLLEFQWTLQDEI